MTDTDLVKADVADLIWRVEKATGPDRDVDWRIAMAFHIPEPWQHTAPWPPFAPKSKFEKSIPVFTGSIDAALALVERCLPGSGYVIGMGRETPDDPLGACAIYSGLSGDSRELAEEEAPTLPLAILLALLTALQSLKDKS